jgi:hypothetical protein
VTPVLNPLDDFPVHQTSEPLAHPASASRNHFDRYFFNGYDPDGDVFFAAAMGLYPNRHVIDAAFSVLVDGEQRSVNASGRAPLDRTDTSVGPIRVEVVEPLRRLRLIVDAADLGMTADVTFSARTPAYSEPHFLLRNGTDVVFDYTRLTQLGAWQGQIDLDGTVIDLDPARHRGVRDRSWGIRPVGEQPEPGVPLLQLPQFFWLWAPLDWGDHATHFSVNEDATGRRWHQAGAVVPLLDDSAPHAFDADDRVEPMRDVRYHIDWQPGTRRSSSASLVLEPWHDEPRTIELEPLTTFSMCGLGYLDSEWGHGRWKDELAVAARQWKVDALDPEVLAHVHVQQLCRATDGERTGVGVFEQLVINEHRPTGLRGFTEGHQPDDQPGRSPA